MISIMYGVKSYGTNAMKVSREQFAENRVRILDAAARLFRERGFEGVSVAEIMQAAGLTHGGFYGHFASKDDLIAQAAAKLLNPPDDGTPIDFADYAATYLSLAHRDDPGTGCLFGALGSESARASPETRRVLTQAVERQILRLAESVPGDSEAARRREAILSWSAMIGALTLARLVDDPALSEELLRETRARLRA
jgi:TetR/AcrR family transcriptional regulator, transcriptional repressor for nem operon